MSATDNANNQPPPSPWKKPKIVSLSRSKSLKRKPDLPGLSENNPSNDDFNQPQHKITKNIFNRFSLNSNLINFKFDTQQQETTSDRNDLFSFFNSGKKSPEKEVPVEEPSQKLKPSEKLTTLNPQLAL